MRSPAGRESDLVVVGAGAAGLMAALVAADLGVHVLVLEKDLAVPCNTALSSGGIVAAGTAQQQAAGVVDDPELMAEDIRRYNTGQSDPAVTLEICRTSAAIVELLGRRARLPLALETSVLFEGFSRKRIHVSPSQGGRELIEALRRAAAADPRIEIIDRTPMRELIVDAEGGVAGAIAGLDGRRYPALRTILAAGGFAADQDMLRRFAPEVSSAKYIGSPAHTGEVLRSAAEQAHAALAHMRSYQLHGHVCQGSGERLAGAISMRGAIMLNRNGRRFTAEDLSASRLGAQLLRQPGATALEIFDARIANGLGRASMKHAVELGDVRVSSSLADVAALAGLDARVVDAEVSRYNDAVAHGQDWLGRKHLEEPLRAPYYAAIVTAGLAHTLGGLKVNPRAEVLRTDGEVVGNLYAAGGTAAGISGDAGATGYLPGNGLIHALALGLIAGTEAARSLHIRSA